jgi:hypothetical protein
MKKLFKAEYIEEKHNKGKMMTFNKRRYWVSRMSYGDYHLVPVMNMKEKKKYYGETKPFHPDTLWLESVLIKNRYGVNQKFFEVV